MTVRDMMAILAKCKPNATVIVETEAFAMGSSGTGMYSCGNDDNQIAEVNDLETRVVIVLGEKDESPKSPPEPMFKEVDTPDGACKMIVPVYGQTSYVAGGKAWSYQNGGWIRVS
jgi:hypothetical protein